MVAAEGKPEDILDRLARSSDAVMAIDHRDKIVLWNKEAERLLGHSSRSVLGRPCHEILRCRDVHGNLYCYRGCTVAHQARIPEEGPVQTFPIKVRTGEGKTMWVTTAVFTVPNVRPSLSTVVHVFREAADRKPPALGKAPAKEVTPREQVAAAILTSREKEILRCLAQGLATPQTARQLGITTVTVRNHTQSILLKLGVHSKLQAIAYAYQHGLV